MRPESSRIGKMAQDLLPDAREESAQLSQGIPPPKDVLTENEVSLATGTNFVVVMATGSYRNRKLDISGTLNRTT